MPASKSFNIHVRALPSAMDADVLRLEWADAPRAGSPVHRVLLDVLESIHGVERASVQRYSAEIDIATHVVSVEDMREVLRKELEEDAELRHTLRMENFTGVRVLD